MRSHPSFLFPLFSGSPEWLLVTCLPVAPPHVRPSVTQGAGMSHDDLTHQYINVIKANNSLNAQVSRTQRT